MKSTVILPSHESRREFLSCKNVLQVRQKYAFLCFVKPLLVCWCHERHSFYCFEMEFGHVVCAVALSLSASCLTFRSPGISGLHHHSELVILLGRFYARELLNALKCLKKGLGLWLSGYEHLLQECEDHSVNPQQPYKRPPWPYKTQVEWKNISRESGGGAAEQDTYCPCLVSGCTH